MPTLKKKQPVPVRLRPHPYPEVEELFVRHPDYERRSMFGVMTAYLGERLVMGFSHSPKDPEWNGVLIPCEREHHASIREDFPECMPHSILTKWLFLDANTEELEVMVRELARLIVRGDARFGIVAKKSKRSSKAH